MQFYEMFLNLFGEGAGEGAGADAGSGSEPGVDPAVAGQERLRELGVPEKLIQRQAKRANTAVYAPKEQTTEEPVAEVAEEQQPSQPTGRMSWEDIMADPEYNSRMQETMQKRLKGAKAAEERYNKLAPVLESLGAKYGMDVSDIGNIDIDALVQAVNGDDSYYEERADELGVSVEQARQLDQLEKYRAREERQKQANLQEQQSQRHYLSLLQQAEELQKTFPSFDLQTELQNPTFLRMTAPGSGISVQDAYYAIHRREIQSAAAEAVAMTAGQKIANAVQANRARPTENGSAAQASSLSTVDYSRMTKQQRADLRNAIHRAAARGEKLTPDAYFQRRR